MTRNNVLFRQFLRCQEIQRFCLCKRFESDLIPLEIGINFSKQTNQMKSLLKFKGAILGIARILVALNVESQLIYDVCMHKSSRFSSDRLDNPSRLAVSRRRRLISLRVRFDFLPLDLLLMVWHSNWLCLLRE